MLSIDVASVDTWLLEGITATDLVTGLPVNISADAVSVALVKPNARPASGDWVSCSWSAKAGAVTIRFNQGAGSFDLSALGAGFYTPWVRLTDSPNVPIVYSASKFEVTAKST